MTHPSPTGPRARAGVHRGRAGRIALGAGAALWLLGLQGCTAPRSQEAGAPKSKVEALLLSCMDYRLIDETERYMSGRGLRNRYDHVILAGASLGATTEAYPAWNETFWEHLDVAIQLHQVRGVIVMDHRDCGAYKVILGEDFARDRARETAVHTEWLRTLRSQINARYPDQKVELLVMGLDGSVEAID